MNKLTIEKAYSLEHHAEGEPRGLAAPLHRIELSREADELRRIERRAGHLAKTLVKLPDLCVVLMTLEAGARLAEHRASGPFTIHVLSGRVNVHIDGQCVELPAGQLLGVARGLPHEVEATEASEVLLTLAPKP
ncbi:MAG: cupin domain-containing protein [Myxococcales bacterium]